jgi:hypothetical protein
MKTEELYYLEYNAMKFFERQWTFEGPHGITSKKPELFITTAVRSSNPT